MQRKKQRQELPLMIEGELVEKTEELEVFKVVSAQTPVHHSRTSLLFMYLLCY
ncbi:hypothetical protein [Sutcliffiella deserti]|uniref:hypothetical protein n=1 Tax=Sutcliffiella deserti TaxID=2875501 RepID=UPI001CBACB28|nr:hypothetical protein [Sutcliffiella deserti]